MNAQQFVDEEEDLDTGTDNRSDLTQGQAGWLRNVVRGNAQVSPDGKHIYAIREKICTLNICVFIVL